MTIYLADLLERHARRFIVAVTEALSHENGVDNCSRTNANLHLRRPPVRVRRPVRPDVGPNQTARRATSGDLAARFFPLSIF